MQQTKPLDSKVFEAVPKVCTIALNDFADRFNSMRLFVPGEKLKENWVLHSRENWTDSREAALQAAQSGGTQQNKMSWDAGWSAAFKAVRDLSVESKRDVDCNNIWTVVFNAAQAKAEKDAISAGFTTTIPSLSGAPAAKKVATDFAADMALMARFFALKDIYPTNSNKFFEHASERVEVWESGHGLAADLEGKLHVFRPIPQILRVES